MKHVFPDDIEVLFIELNFRKIKSFLFGTHYPSTQSDSCYFNNLDKPLDLGSHNDKKLLVGDFNTEVSDNASSTFLYQHNLENLVKDKTCFKPALTFENTTATFTSRTDHSDLC